MSGKVTDESSNGQFDTQQSNNAQQLHSILFSRGGQVANASGSLQFSDKRIVELTPTVLKPPTKNNPDPRRPHQ